MEEQHMTQKQEYDRTKPESIEAYSQRLIGKTFSELIDDYFLENKWEVHEATPAYKSKANKGGLGNIVEKYFFRYEPNSSPEPDFQEAGVELKVTPYKIISHDKKVAKERLIISMIDYMTVVNETFEDSHFWKKAKLILLVYYLYQQEIQNKLDYQIHYSKLFTPPKSDLPTIIHDFETILNKVKSGKAHELSGSDTVYLEAATKSSDSSIRRPQPYSPELAKPRAFAFKNSYMTYVLNSYVIPGKSTYQPILPADNTTPFEEYVVNQVEEYKGKTVDELCEIFGITYDKRPKNLESMLVFRILGVKGNHAEEFEKANIVVKTIRLEEDGKIRESMSFPAFKFKELVEEDWDDSIFGNYLRDTRFFFIVYKKNNAGKYVLKGCQFWNIPYDDLENHVRVVWEKTKKVLVDGLVLTTVGKRTYNNFPKVKDDAVCHVRPHAQNKDDTYELPTGGRYPKQCFWLRNTYIQSQLKKEFFE